MSLFVWNDRRWKLIEENSDYDKKNYLVIRKLFVRWLKSSDTSGINASISKAFEKFGEIESVEDVDGSNAKAKPDIHEAYVTFVRSEDAYKAFVENRNETKSSDEVITVLPIDTWKVAAQSKLDELTELSCRIDEVDEDGDPQFIYKMYITPRTLLRVMRSFIRVSKIFLEGLDLQYELGDTEDESSSDDESEDGTEETDPTEDDATQNESESDDDSEIDDPDSELDCLNDHEFEKRISEVVAKNIGTKFSTLTIRKDKISREMLQWFAPVLKQLNKLTIYSITNCNVLYALPAYCPGVRSLHLDGIEWCGEFDETPIEPWPYLKEIYLNVLTMDDDNKKKLRQFLELNPQIVSLQLESPIDLDTLSTISKTLIELNSLVFVRTNFEGLNYVLDNVAGLTELTGLKMSAFAVEKNHLNGLIKCAKRLSRLQYLQLITIFLNCESDNEKDKDFKHLTEFCVTHHNNCKCHGPNRMLSIRGTDIEVPDESSILALIVNTKSPKDSIDKSLETEILATFKKTTKFFPNIIEHIELEEENSHIYIQISSNR